jgi:zinc transport system substrate-binding protein
MRRLAFPCALALLAVLTFAAAAPATGAPERLKVTATIFPLADLVRQIGGNRVQVVTLLLPGVAPASFRPAPAQVRQSTGSALYLRVGGGLDPWGDDLFSGAALPPLTVSAADLVERLPAEPGAALREGPGGGLSEVADPWVWLDPIAVRDRLLPAITAALTRLRPGDGRYFKVNERKFFESLTKLDQAMGPVFRQLPGKGFLATHAVWGHLARRYGLRQLGVGDVSLAGASVPPLELDRLAEIARESGMVAVFGDPWSKVAPARQLAQRIHGRFLLLDPLGGEGLPGRHSYLALMNYNLALVRNGMK